MHNIYVETLAVTGVIRKTTAAGPRGHGPSLLNYRVCSVSATHRGIFAERRAADICS